MKNAIIKEDDGVPSLVQNIYLVKMENKNEMSIIRPLSVRYKVVYFDGHEKEFKIPFKNLQAEFMVKVRKGFFIDREVQVEKLMNYVEDQATKYWYRVQLLFGGWNSIEAHGTVMLKPELWKEYK
jgi:hypothetical protein